MLSQRIVPVIIMIFALGCIAYGIDEMIRFNEKARYKKNGKT